MNKATKIVHPMCDGCGNVNKQNRKCKVITEPGWINAYRKGCCWAKVTPERAERLEMLISGRIPQERKSLKYEA